LGFCSSALLYSSIALGQLVSATALARATSRFVGVGAAARAGGGVLPLGAGCGGAGRVGVGAGAGGVCLTASLAPSSGGSGSVRATIVSSLPASALAPACSGCAARIASTSGLASAGLPSPASVSARWKPGAHVAGGLELAGRAVDRGERRARVVELAIARRHHRVGERELDRPVLVGPGARGVEVARDVLDRLAL